MIIAVGYRVNSERAIQFRQWATKVLSTFTNQGYVLDKQRLIEASENPELHPDLVVRVTGFTAYFISLSPKFRKLVAERYLEGI